MSRSDPGTSYRWRSYSDFGPKKPRRCNKIRNKLNRVKQSLSTVDANTVMRVVGNTTVICILATCVSCNVVDVISRTRRMF